MQLYRKYIYKYMYTWGVYCAYMYIHIQVEFGTDESDLFIEVSSVQRCPYRER